MGQNLRIRLLRRRTDQIDEALTGELDELDASVADAIGTLGQSLAGKADTATVSALSGVIATKADAASVASSLATKANAASLAAKANTADLTALAATVPLAAATMPPSVADTGSKGTEATRYALADHTHQSSVQRVRMQVAGAAGLVTWTFANPMSAAPVVTATAETPSGATYVNVATIVEGSVTTTQAVIRVAKIAGSQTLAGALTGLLGAVINIFAPAPAGVWVQCVARRP